MKVESVEQPVQVTDFKWLNVFDRAVKFVSGKVGKWQFVSRKKVPNSKTPDAVIIIPFVTDEDGVRRIVLIKEFRVPLGHYEIAFPAGLIDEKENEFQSARRELKEETSLQVSTFLDVSSIITSSAGLTDESVVMVFVECTGKVSTELNEESEDIEVLTLDYRGVCNLLSFANLHLNHGPAGESTVQQISAKTWPILFMIKFLGRIPEKKEFHPFYGPMGELPWDGY